MWGAAPRSFAARLQTWPFVGSNPARASSVVMRAHGALDGVKYWNHPHLEGSFMSRWAIVARAWAVSALAVACALWAHAAAGGSVSSWMGPVLALALGAVVALPLLRARPGWLRTLGLLLPAQLAYHFLFAGMGSTSLPGGVHPLSAHAHHASTGMAGEPATFAAGMHGQHQMAGPLTDLATVSSLSADHLMAAAHLGAALAAAVMVRWGELLLAQLCGRLSLGARAVASATLMGARRVCLLLGAEATRPDTLRWATGVNPQRHRPDSLRLVGKLRLRGPPLTA